MPVINRIVLTIVAFVIGAAVAAPYAAAQTIYEPIRYQYGGQNTFYYGGSDPDVIRRASGPATATWGRINGYAFTSGNVTTHRTVNNDRVRVYTDAIPYWNATLFGFTIDDARNEAYQSAPRYFRKSDITRRQD